MTVRYKIKSPSDETYREVQETLRARNVQVFVASEKRRMISAGNIPAKLLDDIKERGATVTLDQQYDMESRKSA